jgi:folate-binding protein YgfZ
MNTQWQTFLQNYRANIMADEVSDFGNKSQELQGILNENGMADLSHFTAIVVDGQDAENFLQGQLTCDIREVQADQSRLSAYCNLKGRVTATCRVFKYDNHYYLWLPRSMQQIMLTQLKKYALFSKVTITLLDDNWISFGCAGKDVIKIIQQVGVPLSEGVMINISDITPRIIFFAEINTAMKLWQQLAPHLKLVGADAWRLLDIQAGVATIYPETRELFTPQMLDYPKWQAVSFTKGCYLGQEIVARTEYLGRTKRQLCRVYTSSEQRPMPGDKLQRDGQEVGIIVEVAQSPQGGYKMLAVAIEEASPPEGNPHDFSKR